MLPVGAGKKVPRKIVQRVESVPAPVDGLNARDALAAMPPTSAYGLVNWIPQRYGVRSRKGYSEYATGLGAQVNTVMSYFGPADTIPPSANFQIAPTSLPGKVFAATDSSIFDVTSQTSTPSIAQALSGTVDAGYISSVNFSNGAGGWLLCASETDGYFTFDGTTWLKVTMGSGATQVSGLDPTTFCAVAIWKRRVWFVVKSSQKVCYLAVDAPYGAASELNVGPYLKHGGSVAWIANWTIDAGEGIDDYLIICSENGDVLIYQGTDPANASTFSLQGVFYVGEVPKGRTGFITLGGDLLIISNLGIIPVSYITRGGANVLGTTTGDITADIVQLFSTDISSTFNFFGWQMHPVAREDLLVVVVPQTGNTPNLQYVLNTSSMKWTQFNGMPMTCLKSVANWPLFGTADGRVCIAFTNYTDNNKLDGTLGSAIVGLIQPAFSYFQKEGDISSQKHFLMVQPTFLSTSPPGFNVQMNVDFVPGAPVPPTFSNQPTGAVWGVSKWDQVLWGGAQNIYKQWMSVTGVGFAGQASFATSVNVDTTFTSIDYMFEVGGPM